MDTERYQALMAAAKLISVARDAINKEDGPNVISPAWRCLRHAQELVERQAAEVFRAEEVSA